MAYQYVAVRMPAADNPQKAEEVFTERLNAVAAEGWPLRSRGWAFSFTIR
jgi:hypothetical protein